MERVLVDTSVWARHLRGGDAHLVELLTRDRVLTHSAVRLELASRRLEARQEIVALIDALPRATEADDDEIRRLIDRRGLWGRGLALVDLQLLAAALLTPARLWSSERRVQRAATGLGISYQPLQ